MAWAVLQAMYMAWNLSKPASTPAPATPRRMLAPAPFIKDMKPSFFMTWMKQSLEPTSSVESPAPVCSLALTSSRPCTSPGGPPRPKKASTTLVDHPPKHLWLVRGERSGRNLFEHPSCLQICGTFSQHHFKPMNSPPQLFCIYICISLTVVVHFGNIVQYLKK